MNLTLSCRWFRVSLTTDKPAENMPAKIPGIEAKDGGVFEIDGQKDSRELWHPPADRPAPPFGFNGKQWHGNGAK